MNEPPDLSAPGAAPSSIPVISIEKPPAKPFSYWLKRFLACNPFYLVSAALLLFGFYRVSVDPGFSSDEIAQLRFNFTSLQCYEALLVTTAIFLGRRGIWYDSMLLVGLENILVLVPFILISQAALIGQRMLCVMSLTAGIIAIARFSGLKRFIRELNFPPRLVGIGLGVLMVNVALPVVYRILHQSKIGTRPDWGSAYYTNELTWFLLLPAVCALVNLLPTAARSGELPPQARWWPLGMLSLWVAATGVHLYCLGYVYDFSLRPDLMAPAIWVLLWSAGRRLPEFFRTITVLAQKVFLIAPLLVTFLAASQPGKEVFLALTILNAAIYGAIYFHHREDRFALHLLFLSIASLVGGLPEDWGRSLVPEFGRATAVGTAVAGCLLFWIPFSRNPKAGILGAIVIATAIVVVLGDHNYTLHWALQIGIVILLLHSLRWVDREHAGASLLRIIAIVIWVMHSVVWVHFFGAHWTVCGVGASVIGVYFAIGILAGNWGPWLVPLAAVLVMLVGPGNFAATKIQSTPAGLLAVAGSFLLFGLGTLAALTKHRWNKTDLEH